MNEKHKRQYKKRNAGDIVNGAVLIESVNGKLWKMRCKCGNVFISQPSYTSGRCRECGYKYLSKKTAIHNESPSESRHASRLYTIWVNMRSRCGNPNNKNYHNYGGRGVDVCDEWKDYLTFKKWAVSNGYEEHLSIDRIDVNGGYSPQNCRWATQKEQCRNKRTNHKLTYRGVTKSMVEWSEETGIPYHTIKSRINVYGYSVEDALTKPIEHFQTRKVDGRWT